MPPTQEQQRFIDHPRGSFVTACPGAGKTRAVVARVVRLASVLPPRQGIAILSFTNSAIEEFVARCHRDRLEGLLRHPSFVGTFDAFLRQFFFGPGGIEGFGGRPVVLDSWDTLGVEIRLTGPNAFAGDGVSLDRFDASTDEIDPAGIGHSALRAHVERHRTLYQNAARARRRSLCRSGYVSAADVRVHVLARLAEPGWNRALSRALAARFSEVIVDEAQDCNPLDCRIISWMRAAGIRVSVVADPDQAIYGFRHGSPAELARLAEEFDEQDRLTLTNNFRSSPSVCSVSATLRQRETPDNSVGETAAIQEPVHLLAYAGAKVPESVGRRFCELLTDAGIAASEAIVLAHSRQAALRACGRGAEEDGGNSNVARIAQAVSAFWSATASGKARGGALRSAERMILELTGQIDAGELPRRAAERRGVDYRWLRRCSLALVSSLPRHCAATDAGRGVWVDVLRQKVTGLGLTHAPGKSVNQYFRNIAGANWQNVLDVEDPLPIKSATVHDAKGKEYEGVCMVLPPDRAPLRRTETLLGNWRDRRDDEAKRVVYVGLTRAKRLAAIAVPAAFGEQLSAILAHLPNHIRLHRL